MDFTFTEDQEALRRTVRDFAARGMTPFADEWEERAEFPRDLFRKMGELGLAGMACPEEYGGLGLDRLTTAIVGEEIGYAYRPASFIFVHNMVLSLLYQFGSAEQRERWVSPLARGQKLAAFALTEPHAGSDAA
ncbi:MAG: acyl-CoA dehydrogenase family protein, partial [Chloroflexi bacterium]|nr:acyl-CoA dehydrogenase family protein [Chloroflexota bacterium]